MHWAANLIGKPWVSGAQGPDEFDCWGLVRYCLATHFDTQVPEFVTDVASAARTLNWRRHNGAAQEGDVVVMRDSTNDHHVGLIVQDAKVLHAVEGVGVICDPLRQFVRPLYHDVTVWRKG
jgi:cell wall-associated NlpC family hydrolase